MATGNRGYLLPICGVLGDSLVGSERFEPKWVYERRQLYTLVWSSGSSRWGNLKEPWASFYQNPVEVMNPSRRKASKRATATTQGGEHKM